MADLHQDYENANLGVSDDEEDGGEGGGEDAGGGDAEESDSIDEWL